MTPDTLNGYIALLYAAFAISESIGNGVKQLIGRELSDDDNLLVLATWEENLARAATNAGITLL